MMQKETALLMEEAQLPNKNSINEDTYLKLKCEEQYNSRFFSPRWKIPVQRLYSAV